MLLAVIIVIGLINFYAINLYHKIFILLFTYFLESNIYVYFKLTLFLLVDSHIKMGFDTFLYY